MATFTYTPDFGASVQHKPRVRVVSFGDGYQQRVQDGINTQEQSWNLKFANREDAETEQILAFLAARGGYEAFDWTTPDGDAIKAVCSEWSRSLDRHNLNTVTATFRRVYEP